MNTPFARFYETKVKIYLFILLIKKTSRTLFKNKTLSCVIPAMFAVELCTCQINDDIADKNKSNVYSKQQFNL